MLVRQIVIPVSPDQLWDALTEPEAVAAWFGSRVEWDLRPGGQARFTEDDGTARGGVVVDVRPGRHLSFRWWPEEGRGCPSEVNYDLEPEDDGTRLTVTEKEAPHATSPASCARASASAANATNSASWSDWDSRLFQCWAGARRAPTVGGPVGAGRAIR